MLTVIIYALISGVLSLIGGLILLWRSNIAMKWTIPLMAFAAGAFLGVAFLDILPDAIEAVDAPQAIFIAALVGFCAFFIIERLLMHFVHREPDGQTHHSEHSASLPLLVVLGDSAHNFLDGVAIALAYVANPALGLVTTLGIAAHEVPQEIGDFVILLDCGWSKRRVVIVNFVSSLLSIAGAITGFLAANLFQLSLGYLLAVVAGVFIYLGASDLIPELQDRAQHRYLFQILAAFFIGVVSVGYLVALSHGA